MDLKKMKIVVIILLEIVLCFSLMTGATLALFTSNVQDGTAEIRVNAARLDMDLLQADENGDYASIRSEVGDVFSGNPWEPNYTEMVFFKIENNSTVPVKYIFRFNAKSEELNGALEYCVFESEYYDATGESWATLKDKWGSASLVSGYNTLSGDEYVRMEPGEVRYYAVAVHMLEESTNEYQNKSCTIDVNVYAVQANAV